MRAQIVPKLAKWPFLAGDALLLGLAGLLYFHSGAAPGRWEMLMGVVCVVLGAGFSMLPFLVEYRALLRLAEAEGLTTVVARIQNIEQLAGQISDATARWQTVQESADKTARIASDIARSMTAEVKAFNEFIQRSNEGEKATLRLEVDKLRRAESEWVQALMRMLDHVFALHQAAVRSRQPSLIEQLGHFQLACRDAARRVGLAPLIAAPAESFDARRHQVAEGNSAPAADATVEETVVAGYTFQGRLLRPALVRLQDRKGTDARDAGDEADSRMVRPVLESGQGQLALRSAKSDPD
jgi:molecular chaperone GrpE (heat shock protein)